MRWRIGGAYNGQALGQVFATPTPNAAAQLRLELVTASDDEAVIARVEEAARRNGVVLERAS